MANTKPKKKKKELEPGAKNIRKYLLFIFIFLAMLGISLGILYYYGIVSV